MQEWSRPVLNYRNTFWKPKSKQTNKQYSVYTTLARAHLLKSTHQPRRMEPKVVFVYLLFFFSRHNGKQKFYILSRLTDCKKMHFFRPCVVHIQKSNFMQTFFYRITIMDLLFKKYGKHWKKIPNKYRKWYQTQFT